MEEIQRLLGSISCCALPVLFFGAAIAGFIWLQVNASIPGGLARRKKMKAAAAQLGWTYVPSVPFASIPEAPSLYLFSNGSRHRLANLISGVRDGTQMGLFDHLFSRQFSSRTIFVHTAVFTSTDPALPVFALGMGQFFHRAGLTPTGPITFPNHPKFSSEYVLVGPDEAAIRRVFSDAIVEYCEMHPGLCIENRHGLLVVFRLGILAPPQGLTFYFDEANTLLRMFAYGLAGTPVAPPPLPPPMA